jgi:hypothetical protein
MTMILRITTATCATFSSLPRVRQPFIKMLEHRVLENRAQRAHV